LEKRESYHGLRLLAKYASNGNPFCVISASTFIFLKALIQANDINGNSVDDIYKIFLDFIKSNEIMDSVKKNYPEDFDVALKNIFSENSSYINLQETITSIKDAFKKEHNIIYTDLLQNFGNNLRKTGNAFGIGEFKPDNAKCIMQNISNIIKNEKENNSVKIFIIDCIRNPYEAIYLRDEFANFYLISVYANKNIRFKKFKAQCRKLDITKQLNALEKADHRDSGKDIQTDEERLYKQNINKCVQISDIAISNNNEIVNARQLYEKFIRYLTLILCPGCTKPTKDEMFMNLAYAMAVKSNCISRQVGAVIVGKDGYIIGAGYNDVGEGRISCGLREISDLKQKEFLPIVRSMCSNDEKQFDDSSKTEVVINKLMKDLKEDMCFCFKDQMATHKVMPKALEAFEEIYENESGGSEQGKKNHQKRIESLVKNSSIHQLEYCLALHAEENAILQTAKVGGVTMKEGTIYVTAHPCPLCAKKIQQVGIKKVVYTDPYPESLPDVFMANVKLEQFEGVKPRAYIKLFMPHDDQKEWQKLVSKGIIPEW
jgi:dCMP deaminase